MKMVFQPAIVSSFAVLIAATFEEPSQSEVCGNAKPIISEELTMLQLANLKRQVSEASKASEVVEASDPVPIDSVTQCSNGHCGNCGRLRPADPSAYTFPAGSVSCRGRGVGCYAWWRDPFRRQWAGFADACDAAEGATVRRRRRANSRSCRRRSAQDSPGWICDENEDLMVPDEPEEPEPETPYWAYKSFGQCVTADGSRWRSRRSTSLSVDSLSDCKAMCQQQSSCTGIDWKNPETVQGYVDAFERGRRRSIPSEAQTSGNCNIHTEDNPVSTRMRGRREIETEWAQGWDCWYLLAEEPTTAVIFDDYDDLLVVSPGTFTGSDDWVDQSNVPGNGESVSYMYTGQVANSMGRQFWTEADDSICGVSFKAGTAASHVMVGIANRFVHRWQHIYFGTTIRGASSPTLDIFERPTDSSNTWSARAPVYTMDGRANNGDFLNDVYAMRINHDGHVEYSLNGDVYHTSEDTVVYPWHVAVDAFASPSLVDITYLRC